MRCIAFIIVFAVSNLYVAGQGYQELSSKVVQLKNEGKYSEAITFAISAKEAALREGGEGSVVYATSMNNLAFLYDEVGNFSEALPLYIQASALYKKEFGEEHPNYATSLNNLGRLYAKMGNYEYGVSFTKRSLAIRIKTLGEEDPYVAQSLGNLGSMYSAMGNYAEAEQLQRKALTIEKKKLGEMSREYARSLVQLATIYTRRGNFSTAEALIERVMTIRKKVLGEKHPDYIKSLSEMGYVKKQRDNFSDAENYYNQAMTLWKEYIGEENLFFASLLDQQADLFEKKNDIAAAEPLLKQVSAIYKRILGEDHPSYAGSLSNLALIYSRKGDFTKARALHQQALSILGKVLGENNPQYATALSNTGLFYMDMGNNAEAATYFMKSADLLFKHIENNFSNLGESEKLKWWGNEWMYFEIASALLARSPSMPGSLVRDICNQQLQLKGFVLNNGAAILQQVRKSGDPQLNQLLEQWEINRATLARQYSLPVSERISKLSNLERTTLDQEKQINLKSAVLQTRQANQKIGFFQVQQGLKNGEAAVEFIQFRMPGVDSVVYAAFVILPKDTLPHFVVLCEEKQLSALLESKNNSSEKFVKQLYRGLRVPGQTQQDGKKGDSLYKLTWKPLLPWLNGIKKINIAPAGLLNRIAFNALPADSNTFLIDKYQIRTFSSVRQVAEKKIPVPVTTGKTDIVLYGGIQFNVTDAVIVNKNELATTTLPDNVKRSIRGDALSDLPGTLKEVNKINQLFITNKKTSQVITGEVATEESFKQFSGHSPAILHLATHGFSLPDVDQQAKKNAGDNDNQFTLADNPLLRSGLLMAGANRVWQGGSSPDGKDDGILTAYEISNLDLSNTGLVVLSACETALGDIKGTEGVFGLQRAFKLAGVRNMILSLWQVPDAETAELMNLFYTNKLGGMPVNEAFYKAQDVMRKKYPPYFWAAFVLIE
jgi:CHAT domain-containing protein/Flp pilus assembly protein TadD